MQNPSWRERTTALMMGTGVFQDYVVDQFDGYRVLVRDSLCPNWLQN